MTERKEIEKELSELRNEIYEARNLVIKSDNLLRTLHAEIKAVGKTQERFERRHLVSSVAAYAIFAVLAGGAAVFVSMSTSSAVREEASESLEEAAERVEAAETEAAEAQEALDARLEAERVAAMVYERIFSEDRAEQVGALEALEDTDMTLVPEVVRDSIETRAAEVRRGLFRDAWEKGRRAYLAEQMEEAVEHLGVVVDQSRHLPSDFESTARANAAYYLGAARNRLGEHEDAVRALRLYIEEEGAGSGNLAYAHLLLGDSLASLERTDEAKDAFAEGIEVEPRGRHSGLLKRRMDGLGN